MRERPRLAGRLEPASAIERDCRLITGSGPQQEPGRPTALRPADDTLDQRDGHSPAARRGVNKHPDEHRVGQADDEAGRQTYPSAIPLSDECRTILAGRSAGSPLAPDALGKCFLLGERRPKGQRRIRKGMKA